MKSVAKQTDTQYSSLMFPLIIFHFRDFSRLHLSRFSLVFTIRIVMSLTLLAQSFDCVCALARMFCSYRMVVLLWLNIYAIVNYRTV